MPSEQIIYLPQELLSDVWKDETRMNVLFAPFRNRSVNPQDWDSKLSFWKKTIFDCCIHSKVYEFKLTDLQKAFNRDGRTPSCLNDVLDEMYKCGEIRPLEEFIKTPPKTWGKWAADVFIRKPILWSYSIIKESLIPTTITNHTFVHLPSIEMQANNLLLLLPQEFTNKVISLYRLLDILQLDINKIEGTKLVLHHLMCKDKADIREIKSNDQQDASLHNMLIKIGDIKKVKPISDIDISVYILEENEKLLTKNLEKLENEITSIVDQARNYLSKGHRQMAKSCLRKKNIVTKSVNKRANALQNVQILLSKLRESDADSQILDSYKLALATLKRNFKASGLSEDSVIDTMTELGDVLDMHDDIQNTLSQSLTGDDNDLEEELAALIGDDNAPTPPSPPSPIKPYEDNVTKELEKRLQALKLPDVPLDTSTMKTKLSFQ